MIQTLFQKARTALAVVHVTNLIVLAAGFATTGQGAIVIGPTGAGPLTFNSAPAVGDWSTASVGPSASGSITNNAQLDAAVNTNTASRFNGTLGTETAVPPLRIAANGAARWNSAGHWLQTRPTGNSYLGLMATLTNNSGGALASIGLSYDFGTYVTNGSTIIEEVPGHRVYYNLDGTTNNWQEISAFDSIPPLATNAVVTLSNLVTFSSAVPVGGTFYLLWADDNGSQSGTAPLEEGAFTIDNVIIALPQDQPIVIVTQPHSVTVQTCRATNLVVEVTGSAPQYQWFHGASAIPSGTNAIYPIPVAGSGDAGNYFVRISNTVNGATSATVSVTVSADAVPPTVVPTPLVRCGATNILVSFSELMDTTSSQNPAGYHVVALDSGTARGVSSAVLTNGTNVILTLDGPLQAGKNYELRIDSTVHDCPGNGITTGAHVPIQYEFCLLAVNGTSWKYNHEGANLGTDWRTQANFDDSLWSNGISLFDSKNNTNRMMINGQIVRTLLPLTNSVYPTTDIPVYYFRTHFTLTSGAQTPLVTSLRLRTFEDDFSIMWLNNHSAPAHVNPGYTNTDLDFYGYSGGTVVNDANFLPVSGFYSLDPSQLVAGDNVVAAKLHNQAAGSSDITFGYQLTAIVSRFGPPVSVSYSGGQVHLSWPDPDGTLKLYQADTADATIWTLVAVQSTSNGVGSANLLAGGANGARKFFTVRK